MKSNVFSVSSVEEIEPNLQRVQEEGLAPTLAFVFSSVVHNLEDLKSAFAKYNIEVFGASSSGEITNDEVLEDSIAVMLLEISRDAFRLNVFDGEGKSSSDVGQGVAEWAKSIYENPAIMLMSAGLLVDGQQLVKGVIDNMERQVPLFGGLAGDNLKFKETYVFNASQVVANGAVALIFDQKVVELQGLAVCGWKGIGTPKTVTKATGNIVHEIEDEPALDMYNKYLTIGDDPALAGEYPLLLIRDDESVVLRTVMRVNEDKSIAYAGTVPEGAKVKFSMPPGSEIIDLAIEQMSEFNQQFPSSHAIVLFSCKARHMALGPMVEDEISAIHKLWDVPLVGLFTYGEIGPVSSGGCDFHNSTLIPVLINKK
jgi:hypothetical protein